MNIDILHYSSPPVVGGVESVLAHHARLMTSAGHSVRILAGVGEPLGARIPFIQIPLVGSRHPDILQIKGELDLGRVPESFHSTTNQIFDILMETSSGRDILIAHNVASLHKNLSLTAALFRFSQQHSKPRLVLWHHDLAWTTSRYRSELYDGDPWDLLRTQWQSVGQVVVSELRRNELCRLQSIPPQKVNIIPNGLDLHRFLKLEEETVSLIEQLDLLAASPLLLLPVRITPRKNIELALRVLVALRARLPHARLVITGPLGPHNPANVQYFEELRKLRSELQLNGSAHFLAEISQNYLPNSVISDLFRLADALFFPSREEGFGIPVLEAGLCGLPIFCSDIPPFREVAGELANYFEPDADPEIVSEIIHNRLLASMEYQMRTRIRSRYTWEQVYWGQIEPLLNMIVK